jgi:hypothetical protein
MIEEPLILTGTAPGPAGYPSYRVVLGISDSGHMVCAIRVGRDPELVVVPERVTDHATAEAIAEVARIAEDER